MDGTMEQIVRAVTEQVLAALEQEHKLLDINNEGKRACLVLGDSEHIQEVLKRDVVLLSLDDYQSHRNIARYQRVLITALERSDLVDIALGRAGTPAADAVCSALLQGTEVWMLESALPHRAFAGRGSTAFYQMLEGYVNTLQVFGIKLLRSGDPIFTLKAGTQGPSQPVRRTLSDVRLITETMAVALGKDAQEVEVPAGTLITPAAMDAFKAVNVKLIRR
ncbi:MAG: hypothetical protein VB071_13420 [Lawsonibacter sp.]|nr:hypothetical protein [Lawsonibacter sp.]